MDCRFLLILIKLSKQPSYFKRVLLLLVEAQKNRGTRENVRKGMFITALWIHPDVIDAMEILAPTWPAPEARSANIALCSSKDTSKSSKTKARS